ncbi:hypothetical protein DSM112329_04644 [Paraconexibacter sp. AEG42_29]|uniref:ABC transporter permease n=1 Tax=Paraconexibacter sp. AEG42_29 TaxID=2997339 RepID=A0AAU7B1G0_9ACTN
MAVQDARDTTPVLPPRPRKLGRVAGALHGTGEWAEFLGRSLVGTAGTGRYFSEALRQAAGMVRGTLLLMLVMNIFQGMSIGNFGFFLLRALGAGDFMGLVSGLIGPRQTATTMFGYVFCSKICCGITAEIGAMKIQQEIDALESTGVDTMRYIVGTRMVAVIIFVPIACAIALIGQIIGVYIIVVTVVHGLSGDTLLNLNWAVQTLNDQLYVLITITVMAITTAATAMFFGLRTTGGPAAVGSSVAKGILVNVVILHVVAAFFAILFYGGNTKLPIGG